METDIVNSMIMLRDIFAQQAITVAFGVITFNWEEVSRRSALINGPIVALNFIFSDYSIGELITNKKDYVEFTMIQYMTVYIAWICPCVLLFVIDINLCAVTLSIMIICNIGLWVLWKY